MGGDSLWIRKIAPMNISPHNFRGKDERVNPNSKRCLRFLSFFLETMKYHSCHHWHKPKIQKIDDFTRHRENTHTI